MENSPSSFDQTAQSENTNPSTHTTQQQPVLVHPNPEPPKQNFWKLLVIFLVLIVLGLGGGLIYLLQKQTVSQNAISSTIPTSIPSPTITTLMDEMNNWKTYSEINKKLTFRYPNGFSVVEGNIDLNQKDSVVQINIDSSATKNYSFSSIIVSVDKSSESLEQYLNTYADETLVPIKRNTIVPSTQWLGSFKNAPTHYGGFYKEGYIFQVGLVAPDDITKFSTENSILLDQIISTFEIIEEKKITTSDLNTYTNEKHGFTFKYPTIWNTVNSQYNDDILFGPNTTQSSSVGGINISLNRSSIEEYLNDIATHYIKKTNITVNGLSAVRVERSGTVEGVSVIFFKKGTIYSIYYNSMNSSDLKFFDQLISTFKFTQ